MSECAPQTAPAGESKPTVRVSVSPHEVQRALRRIDFTRGRYRPPQPQRLELIQSDDVSMTAGQQRAVETIETTLYAIELSGISPTSLGWFDELEQLTEQLERAGSEEEQVGINEEVQAHMGRQPIVLVLEDIMYERVTDAYLEIMNYPVAKQFALRGVTSKYGHTNTPLLKELRMMHRRNLIGPTTYRQSEMIIRTLIANQQGITIPESSEGMESLESVE